MCLITQFDNLTIRKAKKTYKAEYDGTTSKFKPNTIISSKGDKRDKVGNISVLKG